MQQPGGSQLSQLGAQGGGTVGTTTKNNNTHINYAGTMAC